MRLVLMEPVDTFFFRDHRPFQMGSDTAASGLFPPRPGTVYGALRAAYIAYYGGFNLFYKRNDRWLEKWMGTPERPGVFRLRGVWPFGAGQVLFPLPLDMQVVFDATRTDEGFVAVPLHLKKNDIAGWGSDGSQYRFYARKRQKSESPQGFVVGHADWQHFALAGEEPQSVTSLRRWIDETLRIGIARDPLRGTAEEHMLYRLPMATFSKRAFREALNAFEAVSSETSDPHSKGVTIRYGLGAAVSSTALPDRELPPWLRLGGENRPWWAELSRDAWFPLTDQVEEEVIRCIEKTRVARLILLTPAVWKQGSFPEHYDRATRRLALGRYVETGLPAPKEVEVLAVTTGRPLLVGGWDIVNNRPKPRLSAVPAGTVFVVRVPEGQARMLAKAVRAAALTDDLSWEGYGFVTLGAYCDDRLRP